jgi:type I restriction enzyme S subunit
MAEPRLDMRPEHWTLVRDILRRHADGIEVWAFGSRTKGTAKPYSDLDLALISERPVDLARSAALADAFSESDLPWRVDIVDWATTDDAFRRIIERDRMVIQAPPHPSS